jgi:hypothetical protein
LRFGPSNGAQVQPVQEGLDRQVPVEVEEEADSPPAAQAAQDASKIEKIVARILS